MKSMTLARSVDAASAYNAAAGDFDAPPLEFWQRHGSRTVQRTGLQNGDIVLDAGCGTGASAIPAAQTVGPTGHVTGIDIAEAMLERARRKAMVLGLGNLSFKVADMTRSGFADASFDAVISVFSIFFVADMHQQLSEFWRLLRPGGRLAITVWGENPFQPGADFLCGEIAKIRPDIPDIARPWERTTRVGQMRGLFAEALGVQPSFHVEPDRQLLRSADDWWAIMMGTGYRWFIEQLAPGEREIVRAQIRAHWATTCTVPAELGAIVAVATKPQTELLLRTPFT